VRPCWAYRCDGGGVLGVGRGVVEQLAIVDESAGFFAAAQGGKAELVDVSGPRAAGSVGGFEQAGRPSERNHG